MNREDIDIMWNKALRQAINDGEEFTRYHFAALVAAHVRETEFKPDWNNYRQGVADGAAAEREAIADDLEHGYVDDEGHHIQYAAAIRARGQS